jgi:hypothetical protein
MGMAWSLVAVTRDFSGLQKRQDIMLAWTAPHSFSSDPAASHASQQRPAGPPLSLARFDRCYSQ